MYRSYFNFHIILTYDTSFDGINFYQLDYALRSSSTFLHHFQLMEYEGLQMPGFSQEMLYRWEMILRFPRVDDIDDS